MVLYGMTAYLTMAKRYQKNIRKVATEKEEKINKRNHQ